MPLGSSEASLGLVEGRRRPIDGPRLRQVVVGQLPPAGARLSRTAVACPIEARVGVPSTDLLAARLGVR